MINLLANGLLLAISTIVPAPTPSPCAGTIAVPCVSVTVDPNVITLPTSVATLLPVIPPIVPPVLRLPPVPPLPLPLPPVVVVPQPPMHTPPPPPPLVVPQPPPPVYQPPVYQYTPPAPQPAPDVTATPVHVQQLPSPAAHPKPVTHPADVSLNLFKHLNTVTPKPVVAVEKPAEPAHHQPPFDNSVAGVIGNTVAQYPDFGWVFLILSGVGIALLSEKLDKKPRIKTVGRHSAKLK